MSAWTETVAHSHQYTIEYKARLGEGRRRRERGKERTDGVLENGSDSEGGDDLVPDQLGVARVLIDGVEQSSSHADQEGSEDEEVPVSSQGRDHGTGASSSEDDAEHEGKDVDTTEDGS